MHRGGVLLVPCSDGACGLAFMGGPGVPEREEEWHEREGDRGGKGIRRSRGGRRARVQQIEQLDREARWLQVKLWLVG